MTPYSDADLERDLHNALADGDPDRIAALATLVDERDKPRPVATLHQSALWYASIGLHVFPLTPGTKFPIKGSGGFKDASTDPEMIDRWWGGNAKLNIGIATGHSVDVVDIDGPLGQQSRAAHWDAIFSTIDADSVAKVLTPRPGGMHIYVPATGDGNSAGIVPGVDYRGLGGYVVAPPSVLTEGVCKPTDTPGAYRFLGTPALADLVKGDAA